MGIKAPHGVVNDRQHVLVNIVGHAFAPVLALADDHGRLAPHAVERDEVLEVPLQHLLLPEGLLELTPQGGYAGPGRGGRRRARWWRWLHSVLSPAGSGRRRRQGHHRRRHLPISSRCGLHVRHCLTMHGVGRPGSGHVFRGSGATAVAACSSEGGVLLEI